MTKREGMRARAAAWFADAASRFLAARDPSTALGDALETAQRTRQLLEDVQTAAWHLAGLPSRRDIRELTRRATALSRKLESLEQAVADLESIERETRPPRESKPENGA